MSAPKVFVSYSWTSPDHEAWVLQIATDLVDNGVDIIIDKWNLDKGHDANAFMEQMATNPDIKKVILICDRAYKLKADGRKGGAGTEAQIITPQIYTTQDQNKFVAVLTERDEDGKPLVPAFYASRIYIDLSDPTTYGTGFEELVRWAFDKPLHVKPVLGKPPTYISDNSTTVRLGTSSYQKRAIEAIRASRPNAPAIFSEYLSKFLEDMEKFRISGMDKTNFDEEIFKSINEFLPYRNELFEAISVVSVFMPGESMIEIIHKFFEGTIRYMYRPELAGGWSSWDFDNYRFVAYEMYLGVIAILVRHDRYEMAATLIETDFFVGNISEIEINETMGPEVFVHHLESFEAANQKSTSRKITKIGDVLHERSKHTFYEFRHLCTADIVLHIRTRIRSRGYVNWYAVTPIYLHYSRSSLELFARSRSKKYFDRVKSFIGVGNVEELKALFLRLEGQQRGNFGGGYSPGRSLASLINLENLAIDP